MRIWLAKWRNGRIQAFLDKPTFSDEHWQGNFLGELSKNLYPELTIENSPIEAELKFVKKKMAKTHKWKSRDLWLLPSLRVSKDSIDVTIGIGWWRWHLEFIFPNKGNNSFRGYEV